MKIKLSKSQWEKIGNETGWIKTAWRTPNWNGPALTEIINKNDQNNFGKYLFWLGEGQSESPDYPNINWKGLLDKQENIAPGFKKLFESNGAWHSELYEGFHEGENKNKQQQQQQQQQAPAQQAPAAAPQQTQPQATAKSVKSIKFS